MDTLKTWAAPHRAAVESALGALFHDAWPAPFGEMCRYPLLTGGKRIRPLFAFAAYEAVSGTPDDRSGAMAAAVSVELIHTYSLVHDDLPCMDDDDERRGKPTVHIQYGENNAVLVGDALLTEAFRVLSRADAPDAAVRLQLVDELSNASGYLGMIGGQARDVGVGGPITGADDLIGLHARKTGQLIRSAIRMGALSGDATDAQLNALTTYATAVGLAFQLADDLLDLDEDTDEPSFPKLLGVEETRRRCAALSEQAQAAVEGLSGADTLRALARYTIERTV